MKASIPWIFLLFLGITGGIACAHSQPSEEELRALAPPVPQLGVVRAVDGERVALEVAGTNQPKLFARTIQTQVICAGVEVGWEALAPGEAVRVRWTQDVAGPALAVTVELLQGPEAEAVARDVEGSPPCECAEAAPP